MTALLNSDPARVPRVRRMLLAALAVGATAAMGILPAPAPAHAAFGVIEDEGLALCINRSFQDGRADTAPITTEDLGRLRMQFSCTEGPGIRTFTGFEGATNTLSISLAGAPHDLTAPGSMDALGALPRLSTLNLNKISVSNEAFSGLAGAAKLQTVSINDVPELSNLSALAGKTLITKLQLTNLPALTDLTALADLARLRDLDLGYNRALADLGPLRGLTALERLTIQQTAVADLAPIAGLDNLQSLAATKSRVTSLLPLSALSKLRTLWVTDTAITSLDGLENLSALTHLWASNTTLTGGIDALANKPELTALYIRSTGTTSLAPLAASTKLVTLDAVDNSISSLVGLREEDGATGLSVQKQLIRGPQQFVPVNATTFRVDAAGQVSLRDGATFPALHEPSNPPVGPVADPELPLLRFDKLANAKQLSYHFTESSGFNLFSGNVTMDIVRSEIDSDGSLRALAGSALTHEVTVTEGFPATVFSLGEGSPSWLTINARTGVVTGTPPEAGEFTVHLRVADRLGNTISDELVITVRAQGNSIVAIGADQQAEAGSPLTFTLSRANAAEDPWTGEASVTVTTEPGSAVAGTDYEPFAGRVTWASGDTAPKTIEVTTRGAGAKAAATGSERSFTVELSQPGEHTALAERASATGTIVAKDEGVVVPPGPNPDPKPKPGAGGGPLVETGQAVGTLPWLLAGGALLIAGAGALWARGRRLR